jgi:hypothetical protein
MGENKYREGFDGETRDKQTLERCKIRWKNNIKMDLKETRKRTVIRCKLTVIPVQAWTGPQGTRRLRLPDFKAIGTRR